MSTTIAANASPAPTTTPAGLAEERGPRRLWPQLVVAAAIYLGVSLLLWAHVWLTGSPSHSLTCPCGDVSEQLWWFEWLPRALEHGHNPFYSNAMFARFGGINAMANTSWMLPAAVLSPVTLLFGPIASFNTANLVAPVLTGLAAYALAARFSRLASARFLAGLAFAFSPFVMGNVDLGHVNLTLLAYPPLVLLVGDRLLHAETSPRRAGAMLGVLTVAEAFLGTEVIVITTVLVAGCLVGVALFHRELLVAARRRIAGAAGIAAGICAVVLAYPAYMFFKGPQHVAGPFWPYLGGFRWPGVLFPPANVHLPSTSVTNAGYLGARGPGTGYYGLGILLVIALGFTVVANRRRYWVLAAGGLGCLLFEANVFSFSNRVPILNDLVIVRFSIGTTLCFALMLALVVDGWCRPRRRLPERLHQRFGTTGCVAAALLCVAVAIVPVVVTYTVPFRVQTSTPPRWFTTEGAHVTNGTAVLVLPFAWFTSDRAMAWQAESGLRFPLVGGFGFIPGADGSHDEYLSRPRDATLLKDLSRGAPLSLRQESSLRALFSRWAPLDVVIIHGAVRPAVSATLRAVLGAPSTARDDATSWHVSRVEHVRGASPSGRSDQGS